jgi:hypothetical protein
MNQTIAIRPGTNQADLDRDRRRHNLFCLAEKAFIANDWTALGKVQRELRAAGFRMWKPEIKGRLCHTGNRG